MANMQIYTCVFYNVYIVYFFGRGKVQIRGRLAAIITVVVGMATEGEKV